MDANKAEIMPLFRETYGEGPGGEGWSYWRIFWHMACAELWGYREGEEDRQPDVSRSRSRYRSSPPPSCRSRSITSATVVS